MSLLNDMLQDLQQKPDRDNHMSDENYRTQLKESGMIKSMPVPWLASGLVFIGVLFLLLLLKHQVISENKSEKIQPIEVLNDFLAVNNSGDINNTNNEISTPVEQHLAVQSIPIPVVEPIVQPVVQLPPSITLEQQAQIDQLLILARQAIARDRLTSPFEDNAYNYYQQILVLEPGNLLATQGILQLADRYLAMADKKLAVGNSDSADRLLQRAQLIAPEYSAVITFTEHWQASRLQINQAYLDIEAPEPVSEKISAELESADLKPIDKSQENSISIQDPFAVDKAASHLSVTPNSQWQDQQRVQQAKLLLQQTKPEQAVTSLEDFIATNESAVESTRLLLDIYCEQQRVEDAQRLLMSASYLEQLDQYYFKARLALINNQSQEAINLLETGLPMAEKHEQYRALLAGIYQKSAHYPQAATSYKRLLEVFGEKPAYWLGYALALDAMEQKTSALQAFQRLSEYTELHTEVRQYIEQRIAALRS